MSKRRGKRAARSVPREATPPSQFRSVWLGAITALLVATPLVPSESPSDLGTGVVFTMGWLVVLLGWSLTTVVSSEPRLRWGPTSLAVLLFSGLVFVCGLMTYTTGQPRGVINSVWQWFTFAAVFFLARQIVRTPRECRAVVGVMIALAVCLSVHGFHQYFVSMPETVEQFKKDPAKQLEMVGISAVPGSPEWDLFTARLQSEEPIATFALANSLAGFLGAWLVVLFGITLANFARKGPAWQRMGVVVVLVTIGGCLLLTRSLATWLACGLGAVGVALLWRRPAGLRHRGWLAVAVGTLLLLFPIIAYFHVLDRLSIADFQSLAYRVEYWRATVELIREHPWFGCGPGNFQQFYTYYKLPAASETVADPHNFLLEIWGTLGGPALLAFIAIPVCFAWQLGGRSETTTATNDEPEQESVLPVYVGAVLGLVIAHPVSRLIGFGLDPAVYLYGLPAAACAVLALHGWVQRGELSPWIPACAVTALLVNLLAAGGISYAGVATTAWLLLAIALNLQRAATRDTAIPHHWTWVVVASAGLLLLGMYLTGYRPVLRATEMMAEGRLFAEQGRTEEAARAWNEAAKRDPLAARPWNALAAHRYRRWLVTGSETDFRALEMAAERMLALNTRSSAVATSYGDWLLAGYRRHGNPDVLAQAIEARRRAVSLYPNYNRAQAQLAWALHLGGQSEEASRVAERALKLNDLTPHRERWLRRFQLPDPGPPPGSSQPPGPGPDNAEQWMRRLRNGGDSL